MYATWCIITAELNDLSTYFLTTLVVPNSGYNANKLKVNSLSVIALYIACTYGERKRSTETLINI